MHLLLCEYANGMIGEIVEFLSKASTYKTAILGEDSTVFTHNMSGDVLGVDIDIAYKNLYISNITIEELRDRNKFKIREISSFRLVPMILLIKKEKLTLQKRIELCCKKISKKNKPSALKYLMSGSKKLLMQAYTDVPEYREEEDGSLSLIIRDTTMLAIEDVKEKLLIEGEQNGE